MVDPGEQPEDTLDREELASAIQRCLDNLPDDFRSVVVLVDLQGMDYTEASGVIGKPLGTIKSRLARARLRLRECLQGFGELLPLEFRQEGES
jgi:RNA polymerase sigma-70 factor, ECF subfamily